MRHRGRDSWQLRVYLGTDLETRQQRWLTKTVHGSRRFAQKQLKGLVEEANHALISDSKERPNEKSKQVRQRETPQEITRGHDVLD